MAPDRAAPDGAAPAPVADAAPAREPLTRTTIVATARRMIAEGGLAALSLRRIGAQLGVTAPALYAHVDDKHDLLRAVAAEEFARLVEVFEAVDAVAPLDRVRAYSRAYLGQALANPELFRTMFLFPPEAIFPGAPDADLPIATQAFELPRAAIAAAVADGSLPPATDTLTAALSMWTATHGLAQVLLLGLALDPEGAERLVEAVLDTMIAGLRAGALAG
jgi:AcrR family transcriptional regulator